MCGPIALTISMRGKGRESISKSLLYNIGRITTYTFLGGILGATGNIATFASSALWFQKLVLTGTGALMVLFSLAQLGITPKRSGILSGFTGKNPLLKATSSILIQNSIGSYLPLGLLLGFLPCGLLYTALLGAARAGAEAGSSMSGFLLGSSLLFFFGLGTIPALFAIALAGQSKFLKNRRMFHTAASILLLITGVLFVIRGIRFG